MGDPKRQKKKFQKPSHPWQKLRIDEEKKLMKDYGLSNKKELWKINSLLRNFKNQAKKLTMGGSANFEKKKKDIFNKLSAYGWVKGSATLDDILSLTPNDLLERRLQTIVFRKGFARTIKQARQFIVHKHIMINNKKISSPSYLVKLSEEPTIVFSPNSTLSKDDHPERIIIKKEVKEEKKEEEQEKPRKKPVKQKK